MVIITLIFKIMCSYTPVFNCLNFFFVPEFKLIDNSRNVFYISAVQFFTQTPVDAARIVRVLRNRVQIFMEQKNYSNFRFVIIAHEHLKK